MNRLAIMLVLLSCAAQAQDVLVLGEVHDNPTHHAVQAEKVTELAPAAIVLEMLTPEQADGVTFDVSDRASLREILQWEEGGWPDFAMYYPIFAAAPAAHIYGAGLPRGAAMTALEEGVAKVFGPDTSDYSLDRPLPTDQQAAREDLQFAAHCDALPREMLPGMVEIQRLRDAMLARASLRARRDTGGPVAVITGNGHARRDWGMPAALARVAPTLEIVVIGQTEDDAPLDGVFDTVLSAPAVERPDPCAAFR